MYACNHSDLSRSIKVRLTKKKNTRYEDINLSEKDIEGDQDNNYYVEIIGDQPDSSDIAMDIFSILTIIYPKMCKEYYLRLPKGMQVRIDYQRMSAKMLKC